MDVSIKADPSKIELALHGLIFPKLTEVCDFVKVGPRNTSKQESKMVYCNAPVPVVDLNAISQTTARIEIYVEQISGFKDTTSLSEIRDIIVPLINGVTINDSYFVTLENELSMYDNAGFNFIFLNLAVTII
jgi:hypothetical protein